MTTLRRLYRLTDGVRCLTSGSGATALLRWPHAEKFGRLTPREHTVLRELVDDRSITELTALCPAGSTTALVAALARGGWTETTVVCGERRLYSTRTRWPPRRPPVPARPGRLSRFASVGRDGDGMLVASPTAARSLRIADTRLLETVMTAGASHPPSGLPAEAAQWLLTDLEDAGLLAGAEETDELRGAQWSPHELAFHHDSRLRRDHLMGEDFGGTYWAKGRFDPPPARHPAWATADITLHRPDPERLHAQDPPLSAVMERRRSIRSYADDDPLTVEELGEFLFRTARVRTTGQDTGLEVSDRPWPAGGAAHELEVYPLVHNVQGLPPGLYHYDPHGHGLSRVPATATHLRWLMTSAAAGMNGGATPQVLFVIATRYGRLSWKYRAMAYALTLKHVGVLQQTMYLAATAMGLAPCALGVGDADAFAAATGLDVLEETSVGEFALGRPPSPEHGEDGGAA
ncbi:SagB family peptide dehydrogenase [Streptomyces sp. NPDC045714]|uniref:SagB/ThcOx family dehydrogenase n=1 Tax=Streptomyces sp. NPDC045714 TaxID=3154913 RepID=UPI0033F644BF